MKKNKEISIIVRTSILSGIVFICLFFMILLIPLNLHANIQSAIDSVPPLDGDVGGEGQLIYYGAATVSIAMLMIFTYLIAGVVLVLSIVGIVLGVVNCKTGNKGLLYYNYVLIGLMFGTSIACIVKMILWHCGY